MGKKYDPNCPNPNCQKGWVWDDWVDQWFPCNCLGRKERDDAGG